jgi:hypothetical protein
LMASLDLPRLRLWDSHLPKGKLTSITMETIENKMQGEFAQ